jgi:predicted flap endonuclease-1-like 5' DNA nuclease
MAKRIEDIEGIGPAYAEKLRAAGISDTDALLERCGPKKAREQLSSASGIAEARIPDWVNMADLFRIPGVGSEYAELLEAAGVGSWRSGMRRIWRPSWTR